MSYYNWLLLLFLIFATCDIIQASVLYGEGLVSDYVAEQGYFTYQVAIMGKKNGSGNLDLVCGGAIIAENLILTAAQCFVDELGFHKELTFVVIAGKVDLLGPGGYGVLVSLIYLPSSESFYANNIAIAQLLYGLDIYTGNSGISSISYSSPIESFWGENGTVAGYGHYYYDIRYSVSQQKHLVRRADTDYKLRYATVQIMYRRDCSSAQVYVNFNEQFCSLMFAKDPGQKAGICRYDSGSPLVIDNKVVAVANTNNIDCDDTITGGLYTKVQSYSNFIDGILYEDPVPGTVIYQNREHISSIPIS